ncbi:MAG: hypothetical protein IK130_09730 [Oscillospiraceae bacterium]|nr:hypothetical protein [Oscillospiraceae bacterium]
MELDPIKIQNTSDNTDVLLSMLEHKKLKYKIVERTEARTRIRIHFEGNGLPITIYMILRADRQIVSVFSLMPFTVPEGKRYETAIAVAAANHGLIDGSFDLNTETGEIRFRLTSCYIGTLLCEELFSYLMYVSAETVDRYDDRFDALANGRCTLEDFIRADEQDAKAAYS